MEDCHGLDKLEGLQRHENEEIYDKAVKILKTYFDSEEEETLALAPEVATGGATFGFGNGAGGGAGASGSGAFHFT